MDDCLSEDTVAALLDGTLDEARFLVAERHLSECEACLRLVAQVGRALSPVDRNVASKDVMPALGPGSLVGRYRIISLLGAGGMGRVYAAEDPTLDRNVALKVLHPGSTNDDLEARLLREAKSMARLSHPEVITIHDVGRHEGLLFIAMELVLGGTLREWLATSPRSWREILAVYLRAGRGLAVAHAARIIHRDFKPDNVLIGGDGRVRVTDFGLARATGTIAEVDAPLEEASTMDATLTRTGALVGTPVYMAPEQAAGRAVDARSDLYSFCVALHEALCGVRPFRGATFRMLQEAKRAGAIDGDGARLKVPQRLLRAVALGLRPHPEDRYPSMDVLLATLERAARTPRWPFVAAVAVASIAIAAVTLAARARSPSEARQPASASATLGCTSSHACVAAHDGAPYLCRASDHSCVAVASEDCVPRFEPQDLANDDTVWLGAMFPARGPSADDFGAMNLAAVDLARSEIAQATRAFDGPNAAKRVRRVALVACDDTVDASRAAQHLVLDVGVPAVLGFRSGQEVVDLAGSLFVGRNVLSVATLTASPLITRIPQPEGPRLVWRTTYNLEAVAGAAVRIVEDVLAPRGGPGPVRVTLVRLDAAGALSFAERVFETLHLNGKPVIDSAGAYTEIKAPPHALGRDELARLADRVAETRPSIVVIQGGAWFADLVELVEARMASARRKPSYLGVLYSTEMLAPFMGTNVDRRHRVWAIESFSGSVSNARFVLRYNEANAKKVTRTSNGGASYDAFYLLAYAAFAQGNAPLTGTTLAAGFGRLVGPGRAIAVGPSDVFDALTALDHGESINLEGTQSALDFDLRTGDEPSDFALLCSNVDSSGRATGEDVESGIVYEAATRKLAGVLRCP